MIASSVSVDIHEACLVDPKGHVLLVSLIPLAPTVLSPALSQVSWALVGGIHCQTYLVIFLLFFFLVGQLCLASILCVFWLRSTIVSVLTIFFCLFACFSFLFFSKKRPLLIKMQRPIDCGMPCYNNYIDKTTLVPKTQVIWQMAMYKDCKNRRTKKSDVRLYLLEKLHLEDVNKSKGN